MKIIETERLILRTWRESDAESFFQINQDPRVIEFIRGPITMEQIQNFIKGANEHHEKFGYSLWAAELKDTGMLPKASEQELIFEGALGKTNPSAAEYMDIFEERRRDLTQKSPKRSIVQDSLIGFIGLNFLEWETPFTPAVEIGWRLGSQYWGNGYATEGAKACLEYGFKICNLKEIIALTVPDNKRSIHLMEKLGMKRDPENDFAHPKLAPDHKLSKHILYRIAKDST